MGIQKPGLGAYQVGDLSGDLTDGRRLRSAANWGMHVERLGSRPGLP